MSGRSTVAGGDPRRHAVRAPTGRFAPKATDAATAASGRVRETPAGAAATPKDTDPPTPPAQGGAPAGSLAARLWRDGLRAVRR